MTTAQYLLLILVGGLLIPGGVYLIARGLVFMQSDPKQGQAYLEWFRAQKAAERDEAVRAELAKPMPALADLRLKEPANR